MAWIEAKYYTNQATYDPTVKLTADTLINLAHVRRIACTDNGWARVYWTQRVTPIVVSEPYEHFVARVRAACPPATEPPTQGEDA